MTHDLNSLMSLRRVVDFQLVLLSFCFEDRNEDFPTPYMLEWKLEVSSMTFNYCSLQLNITQIKHGRVTHKAGTVVKPQAEHFNLRLRGKRLK